jgi:hypothetical protein
MQADRRSRWLWHGCTSILHCRRRGGRECRARRFGSYPSRAKSLRSMRGESVRDSQDRDRAIAAIGFAVAEFRRAGPVRGASHAALLVDHWAFGLISLSLDRSLLMPRSGRRQSRLEREPTCVPTRAYRARDCHLTLARRGSTPGQRGIEPDQFPRLGHGGRSRQIAGRGGLDMAALPRCTREGVEAESASPRVDRPVYPRRVDCSAVGEGVRSP